MIETIFVASSRMVGVGIADMPPFMYIVTVPDSFANCEIVVKSIAKNNENCQNAHNEIYNDKERKTA